MDSALSGVMLSGVIFPANKKRRSRAAPQFFLHGGAICGSIVGVVNRRPASHHVRNKLS
jgi:hypothetical protein